MELRAGHECGHETGSGRVDAETKERLRELIERGDVYGLMLAAVGLFVGAYHPESIRAAVYAVQSDDAEPTRIRIPLSGASPARASAPAPRPPA